MISSILAFTLLSARPAAAADAAVLGELRVPVELAACKAEPKPLPAGMDEAKKAIVTVVTPDGTGSAVIVNADGTALTAAHVVGAHKTVSVRVAAGFMLDARVQQVDVERDLAVLDITGNGYPCLPAAKARGASGAGVFAVGSPLGENLAFSVSKGVISGYPTLEKGTFLQTDASINPGNSGGPVLSEGGELLGIVSWKIVGDAVEGVAFAVPIDVALDSFALSDVLIGGVVGGVFGPGAGVRGTGPATLVVSAKHPDVTIGLARDINGAMAGPQGPVAIYAGSVDDLCIAPCEKPLKAGVYTLIAYGDGVDPVRQKVELRPGERRVYDVQTRSKAVSRTAATMSALGFTTAIVGGSIWGTAALISSSGEGAPGLESAGRGSTLGGLLVGLGGVAINFGTKPRWVAVTEGGLGAAATPTDPAAGAR